MIVLRKYVSSDAHRIVEWITDERMFRLWCADRFKNYPLSAEEFNGIYKDASPDFYGMIAEDEGKTIGHFFIKSLGERKYKFGLIIVDSKMRGKGYGKKMLETALDYAKTTLNAASVTLSVFHSNTSARLCYNSLGFKETGRSTEYSFFGEAHNYAELEYTFG